MYAQARPSCTEENIQQHASSNMQQWDPKYSVLNYIDTRKRAEERKLPFFLVSASSVISVDGQRRGKDARLVFER